MSSNSESVISWRKRTRKRLILLKGDKCSRCGWRGHSAGYDFHHEDPSTKEATIASMLSSPKSFERLLDEVGRCVLLCVMCHRLEHAGRDYDEAFDGQLEQTHTERHPERFLCPLCGGKKTYKANRCSKCVDKTQAVWGDTDNEFMSKVGDPVRGTWSKVSRLYGVSDNAVRKRWEKISRQRKTP